MAVKLWVPFTTTLAVTGDTATVTPVLCFACPELGSIISPDTSTTSKFAPVTFPRLCRSSSFQRVSGAPEMYHDDPLSARIIPYFFSARRITWFAAENPEISKLAFSLIRIPIGGYWLPVRLDA